MLDYTHAQIEVTRDDFHMIMTALRYYSNSKRDFLERTTSCPPDSMARIQEQIDKIEDIDNRMDVRFITPCTIPFP